MFDFYEPIRRSMFAYFCRHHGKVIEAAFAVPKKLKIRKHRRLNASKGVGCRTLAGASNVRGKIQSLNCNVQDSERQSLESFRIQGALTETNQVDLGF